jgi:hypothetical protein
VTKAYRVSAPEGNCKVFSVDAANGAERKILASAYNLADRLRRD